MMGWRWRNRWFVSRTIKERMTALHAELADILHDEKLLRSRQDRIEHRPPSFPDERYDNDAKLIRLAKRKDELFPEFERLVALRDSQQSTTWRWITFVIALVGLALHFYRPR